MAELKYAEKQAFEKLFEMGGGYVLDFSNRTFEDFIYNSIGINIYESYSASKAWCLRYFMRDFDDRKVGRLLYDLLDYYAERNSSKIQEDESLRKCYETCKNTVNRLLSGQVSLEFPNVEEMTLKSILEEVKNALDRNKPEAAIDRLHTFTVKYIRDICVKCNIETEVANGNKKEKKTVHSLWGELTKKYSENGRIQSETVATIMKANISIMDKFNAARNNESMAHDNDLISSIEAEYIVKSICNALIFVDSISKYTLIPETKNNDEDSFELPF